MAVESLADVDFTAWPEPDPHLELRTFFESWLAYQRHEFLRKLRDLDAEQLATWSVPPVELSVLGLVRHMTQMELVWLTLGLGGGELILPYGDDDYAGGSANTVDDDIAAWFTEIDRADAAVAAMPSLDAVGQGHGRSLQATLVKMIHEYTLHAGQAHMLRFAALGEMIR
ncbi:MAG: DinB family protein [Acidimicrobiia bacterium]|nr:DinB family protein [Acidimicrobiia bacterium]